MYMYIYIYIHISIHICVFIYIHISVFPVSHSDSHYFTHSLTLLCRVPVPVLDSHKVQQVGCCVHKRLTMDSLSLFLTTCLSL